MLIPHPWDEVVLGGYTVLNFAVNGVAQSLDAPTAQSTPQYRFWFRLVNYVALNSKRANSTTIEQSPNFVPAAEAYMQQRLKDAGRADVADKLKVVTSNG